MREYPGESEIIFFWVESNFNDDNNNNNSSNNNNNNNTDQGSISPNFVRQAQSRRRTAFSEKFANQFHQLIKC